MQHIAQTFSAAIREAVFNLDDVLTQTILTGIKQNAIVVGVSLYDNQGSLLGQSGDIGERKQIEGPFKETFSAQLDLFHQENSMKLASIQLYSNNLAIYERLKYGLILVLINSFLKTLILWVFMIYFLKKYLARPIGELSGEVANIDLDKLQKLESDYPYTNELSTLHDRFNDLISRLSSSRQTIEDHRRDLEETIDLRTKQLRIAKDEAEMANKQKSIFLSNMSHELRTPLNAIIGYGELIAEEQKYLSKEDMVKDVKKITTSGQYLLKLINEILDISKIEAGRMDFTANDVDVELLCHRLVDNINPILQQNNNKLELEIDPIQGEFISDGARVSQILLNVLGNAAKYTKNGKIIFRVFEFTKNESPGIMFYIEDTGMGIAPHDLEKVFDKFVQVHDTTKDVLSGSGLGLPFAKKLTEILGGTITASSTLGQGSVFKVFLPNQAKGIGDRWIYSRVSGE